MGWAHTYLPKNRQTQLLRTTRGARGSIAPYNVKKRGKKELTATSNAYANSTLLSIAADEDGERRRRLAMRYRKPATANEDNRKSPDKLGVERDASGRDSLRKTIRKMIYTVAPKVCL